MTCDSTKRYIEQRAKEKNLIIPNNYEEILEYYVKIVEKKGHKLEFRKGRNMREDSLNANAGFFRSCSIVATPEWATQLTLYSTEKSHNAFLITLGHELTHKDNDIFFLRYGPFYIKFIAYVNELHADFGASKKMANSNRQILLDSLKFKKSQKDVDEDKYHHPSLLHRINYAEQYDFGEELIQKIAEDIGCRCKWIINRVCNHFSEIKLSPPPEKECE